MLGKPDQLHQIAAQGEFRLDGIELVDPAASLRSGEFAAIYARRRHVEEKIALRLVKKPLVFGGMMVAEGDADTMVAGVANATATVIQAAAVTIGYAPGIQTASSFFLMVLPEFAGQKNALLLFADCAVNIQPTAAQLADIALATYQSPEAARRHSPAGDALLFHTGQRRARRRGEGPKALQIVQRSNPDAWIDGEFQADTALVARVAAKKVKRESHVAGAANVLVFPDLDAGNIAYKLTQYLAGARHRPGTAGFCQADQRLVARSERRGHRGHQRHLLGEIC